MSGGRHEDLSPAHMTSLDQSYFFIRHINFMRYNNTLSTPAYLIYEGPSKSSVMNGSPCARRGYASLILCVHISHSIIHPHVKFPRN